MVRLNYLLTWALSAGVASLAVAATPQASASQEDLAAQVRSLQAEVEQLKADRLTAADVDATVQKVLADADHRSQLLAAEGFTAGYSNGKFLIQSADGNFVLHPSLQWDFRYIANMREDSDAAGKSDVGQDDVTDGFEFRRAKLGFDGNLFTPDLTYYFLWASGRDDGILKLEECWMLYKFADQWSIRAGQYKDPVAHEGLNSSKKLMAVERTYLQDRLGLGDNFIQGVSLVFGDSASPFRAEVAYTDGAGSVNTNFQGYDSASDTLKKRANYGVAGRFEYLAMGKWKSYEDFTDMGNKDDMLVLGCGADLSEYGDMDVLLHTVDVQYENAQGFGFYAAYLGRCIENNTDNYFDWGFLVQVSQMLDDKWEIFGRYDYTSFDRGTPAEKSIAAAATDKVHEITAGMNYYFKGHSARLTVDFTYLPDGAPLADDGAGILGQSNDSSQFLIRGQYQLLI